RTVLSKRDASNLGSGGYDLVINNGAPTFRWGNISVSTSTKLTTSRWYHLAVSYNGDKYVLYVDGLDVGTKTGVNPLSIESPFIIGAMYNNTTPEVPSNYFKGWIEELRIWNKALSEDQLHFMMNQRLEIGVSPVKGTILPLEVPGTLSWSDLQGYYQLVAEDIDIDNGLTLDEATSKIDGVLKNMDTNQDNSAPLPYKSSSNDVWSDKNTWARPDVWDYPNALGINGERIDWNIAEISHEISSGGNDIKLLGLISKEGTLNILNPNDDEDETNSGQGLFISHYLKLNGSIDLIGESQLVQTEGSILDPDSAGYIERDQQGTASSFNYNYWSSPVVPQGNAINSTYSVAGVMMDGTDSKAPIILNFGQGVTFADGALNSAGNSQEISNYWIYKFRGKADEYSDFKHIGSTGVLNVGEGYTMKGTSGRVAISDRQNYVFKGMPNNGNISLTVGKDQNYLLGNPYPSAIDANKFILDNLSASGGTNTQNIFNGALYFWDHFGGKT
ncbi:MAG TPA: LamG domain-containing protein, partial [Gillisia sp.]|nr:LamG domain-containing protein [Gillisia sp.]